MASGQSRRSPRAGRSGEKRRKARGGRLLLLPRLIRGGFGAESGGCWMADEVGSKIPLRAHPAGTKTLLGGGQELKMMLDPPGGTDLASQCQKPRGQTRTGGAEGLPCSSREAKNPPHHLLARGGGSFFLHFAAGSSIKESFCLKFLTWHKKQTGFVFPGPRSS